ncbi:DUF4189 domain-containing protein [Nocardia altamirensis]|uniref:DUF4189 domain-containing protein n=1 Tax=Nocardia altamirensis TaxID=472158 RepID=UPI0008401341|nr:DUF4189 domain-containing protein [Nocardia altamirensis]
MRFMGKAVVAVAAVGLGVGSVIGAGTANAASYYGAIAFSGDNWSYGSSVNARSREQALDEALASCGPVGVSDCAVLAEWSDGCGALVYSTIRSTTWAVAVGTGPNRSAALFAAHTAMAQHHPPAMLANVGSADKSGTAISEVLCTANAS